MGTTGKHACRNEKEGPAYDENLKQPVHNAKDHPQPIPGVGGPSDRNVNGVDDSEE